MALADITLNDGQGTPVAHTFTYISTTNGRVIRADMAAPAEEPITLTLGHLSKKTASGKVIRSHLLRVDFGILDSDGVTVHNANIRVMCDLPDAVRSDSFADDASAFVRNALTSAFTRTWIRDSVG